MGAFNTYLATLKGNLKGSIPLGGTLIGTSEGVPMILAQQIIGGFCVLDSIDTLVDIPYDLLTLDMEVVVRDYAPVSGPRHPRTRYTLRQMPSVNTKVNEVVGYLLADYWVKVDENNFSGETESQYAPNYLGKRPKFLPTEISSAAYQAGYPDDTTFGGGNPSDIIWVSDYDPLKSHVWTRQRLVGTSSWGIPVSLNAGGDYEDNQYIDTIFKWVSPKGTTAPDRPIQPTDYTLLPTGWQNTPGNTYDTRILTEDLYRSQMLKGPYGKPKSDWDLPLLVSSDPQLVRYGNTPGNTDFFNVVYWRGYFTPGLDTHQATRPDGASSDWTIVKIDQESGEFPDFVFKNFPIAVDESTLIAATPTFPYPVGGIFPNDAFDAAPAAEENKVLYQSSSVKYPDGSLKRPWSLWRRFDGLNVIQAVIDVSPGDTFFFTRNTSGVLVYTFPSITLAAKLYNGVSESTTGFNTFKWYKGATLIVFDSTTHKATNLGAQYNQYHEVSVDGKSLTINPQGFDITQQYKVGINHVTRPSSDYLATVLLKDTTDDGNAFVVDIVSISGTTFKNGTGLYQFNSAFFKGGELNVSGVVFTWTIKDALGAVIANGLRNSGGVSVGDEDYAAATVYVSGADIDQYATLELTATFGDIVRTDIISLTDVADAEAMEVLYWGTGSTDPGSPTDFTPRTLTKTQVLALAIGYLTDATGAWYMIQRVNGLWGGEIQLRTESARPNGGIALPIYKNVDFAVDGAPSAPTVPPTGSLIPAGWTQNPTAFTGSQDRQYTSICFFLLRTDVTADATVLTRANYNPSGTYSTPYLSGVGAPPPAVAGAPGNNGWSPLLAYEVRPSDSKVVSKVYDWFGGMGTKPAANTLTSYIGLAGLGTIANAQPISGPPGNDALTRPQEVAAVGSKVNGPPTSSFTFGTVFQVVSGMLPVTNTWSQTRAFLIRGEVPVSNTSGAAAFAVQLFSTSQSDPFGLNTKRDENFSRVDFVNASPGSVHKIRVEVMMNVAPGDTLYFFMKLAQLNGSSGLYQQGFLQSFGI
jgi:hypothetical protein